MNGEKILQFILKPQGKDNYYWTWISLFFIFIMALGIIHHIEQHSLCGTIIYGILFLWNSWMSVVYYNLYIKWKGQN